MPPSWMPSTSQKDIVSPWSFYPPSMSSVDSPANCRCHRRFGDWSPICNLTNKSKRHQADTSTQTNSWKQLFHQKDGRIKDLMILGPFGCLPRNPSLADPWPNWSLGTRANAQEKRGSNQRSNFDWKKHGFCAVVFEEATFPVKDRRMSNCEDSCVLDTARRKCTMCIDVSEWLCDSIVPVRWLEGRHQVAGLTLNVIDLGTP